MRKLLMSMLLLCASMSAHAYGQLYSTEQLYAACSSSVLIAQNTCVTYVKAVYDTMPLALASYMDADCYQNKYGAPSLSEFRLTLIKYLEANPKEMTNYAPAVIMKVFLSIAPIPANCKRA